MSSLIIQSNYAIWLSQVTYYFFLQKKSFEKEAFIFIYVAFSFLFLYTFESWHLCLNFVFFKQKVEHNTFVNFISHTHILLFFSSCFYQRLPYLSYKMVLLEQLPPHPFLSSNWAIFAQIYIKKTPAHWKKSEKTWAQACRTKQSSNLHQTAPKGCDVMLTSVMSKKNYGGWEEAAVESEMGLRGCWVLGELHYMEMHLCNYYSLRQ